MRAPMLLLGLLSFFGSMPAFGAWGFARPIALNHTQAGGSDAADFTVLISGTYPYLATVANSGKIRNTVACGPRSIACPADLIYTSDSACSAPLSWELETWSAVTGLITVWVKVPVVSHLIDTTIYQCYGNAAVTTFQGGAAGSAWNSHFKLIEHFGDGATLNLTDSTTNGNTTAASNASAAAGKTLGGIGFGGSSAAYIAVANNPSLDSNTGTWSAWIQTSQSVSGAYPLLLARADAASSLNGISLFLEAGTGRLRIQLYSGSNVLDLAGGAALNDGAWHLVAFTFAGTGVATLFVDGAAVASGSPSGAWAFKHQVLRAGTALDGFWTPLNGLMDELEISDGALTADWMVAAYNNQNSPATFCTPGDEITSPGTLTPKGGSQPIIG